METQGHTNGGNRSNGSAEGFSHEIKEAVTAIGSELNENLHALSAHIGNAQSAQRETLQHLDRVFERWVLALQHQFQSVEQKFEGFLQEIQSLQQHAQGLQQQFQVAQQQLRGNEQKLQGFEPRLAANIAEVATLSATVGEEARRRSNVEISIGELTQEITKLRTTELANVNDEVDKLRAAAASSRRRQSVAIAASVLALLAVGYIGLGKPGWPVVASYVAPWLPPWSI